MLLLGADRRWLVRQEVRGQVTLYSTNRRGKPTEPAPEPQEQPEGEAEEDDDEDAGQVMVPTAELMEYDSEYETEDEDGEELGAAGGGAGRPGEGGGKPIVPV